MAVDLEWEGKYDEAFRHYALADKYLRRHSEGDIHEPSF